MKILSLCLGGSVWFSVLQRECFGLRFEGSGLRLRLRDAVWFVRFGVAVEVEVCGLRYAV